MEYNENVNKTIQLLLMLWKNRRAEWKAASCSTLQQQIHNLHLFYKIIQVMKAKHKREFFYFGQHSSNVKCNGCHKS